MSNIQYIQNYEPGVGLTLTPKTDGFFLSDNPNDYNFYCCLDGKPFVACDSENGEYEYLVAVNKRVKFDHYRLFCLTNGQFMPFGGGYHIEFGQLAYSWRSVNLKIETKIIYSIELKNK